MNRRKFILGSTAAVSIAAIGSYTYFFYGDDYSGEISLHPFIQDFLSDEELSNIKKEYLANNSFKNDLNIVEPEKLRNKIKEDFNLHKVKIVDGWVLSDTELEFLANK